MMTMKYGHLFPKALYWGEKCWAEGGNQVTLGGTDSHKPSVRNTAARTRKVAQNSVLGYYIMFQNKSRINMGVIFALSFLVTSLVD